MIIPFMLDKHLVFIEEYGGRGGGGKLKVSQMAQLRVILVTSNSLTCVLVGWFS